MRKMVIMVDVRKKDKHFIDAVNTEPHGDK